MKRPEFSDPKGVFQEKFQELNEAKQAQLQALQPQIGMPPPPMPPEGQPPASPEELAAHQPMEQGTENMSFGHSPLPIDQR